MKNHVFGIFLRYHGNQFCTKEKLVFQFYPSNISLLCMCNMGEIAAKMCDLQSKIHKSHKFIEKPETIWPTAHGF